MTFEQSDLNLFTYLFVSLAYQIPAIKSFILLYKNVLPSKKRAKRESTDSLSIWDRQTTPPPVIDSYHNQLLQNDDRALQMKGDQTGSDDVIFENGRSVTPASLFDSSLQEDSGNSSSSTIATVIDHSGELNNLPGMKTDRAP